MPSAEQVRWAKFRVIMMSLCALGIASVLTYLLLGGAEFLQPALTIHAYMSDLLGLEKNSAVRFNGIRVGKVTGAALSHLPDPQKAVRVDMSLGQHFAGAIPEDSTVVVTAQDVLDDKYIDINAGKSPRHIQQGAELFSPPPKQFNQAELLKSGRDILAGMDRLFSDIEAGRGPFGKLVKGEELYDSWVNYVTQFQKQIRAATSKETPAGRLIYDEAYYDELRAPLKRLDDTLAEIQAGRGTGGKLLKDSAQYDQLRKAIGDLKRTFADLNAGKGTAGRLLKSDELYVGLNRMIDNLSMQVDALNSGEGAVGHLLASASLYEGINGSMKNLRDTIKEFRGNPKKFLYLKVF
jgi:phospholipid/cholesterol/gamma-HCH transport system substrate-binding protein